MKRILLLIKGLGRGGAERLLLGTVRELDRTQYLCEVAYLVPELDTMVPEFETMGLTVHCLGGARGFAWVFRLRKLIQERQFDLVHAHLPYAGIGARLALWRNEQVPLVYTEHSSWDFYKPITRIANMLTYARNSQVIAVSEHVRESILYPKLRKRQRMPDVEVILHGIDHVDSPAFPGGLSSILGIPAGAPVIGSVGNFRKEKGHRYLVQAARAVCDAMPDARLILVGTGPLEGSLRRLVAKLNLEGTVIFAGYRGDAERLMQSFDVFVVPSLYEGLSIALIEAMSLGLATVVTATGGLLELVQDGQEGLLVPPGDSKQLAQAILTLLRDPAMRRRLGVAARNRASDLNFQSAIRRIEAVYAALLSRKNREPSLSYGMESRE